MEVVNTDVEQIWQTIEALPPESREVIRTRLLAKANRNSPPISPISSLDDAIFKIAFDKYLDLPDDERDAIHTSAYAKYRNWIDAELERRGAEWMLVVGGDVIEAGESLDEYPSREKLYKSGHHFGVIPFVFVANPVIEESSWAALLKNDFYPTVSINLGSSLSASSQNTWALQADFDTGSFHTMLDYDSLLQRKILDRQPIDQANEGSHLERKFKFHIATLTIGIIDESGQTFSISTSISCVRNWQQSPFCLVNAFRKALVGRGLLLKLPIRLELNGQDRSTKAFSIS